VEITFINLIEDIGCNSLRYLSSYLKLKGHKTKLIFLCRKYSEGWGEGESYRYPFEQGILEKIAELSSSSGMIGISLMSCHFDNAIYITRFLKERFNKPVIWGGVHPTIRPLECLKYADAVCVGEGEQSIAELLNQLDSGIPIHKTAVQGILVKGNAQVIASPKLENLDELGYPDFDMVNQYVLYNGQIVKLSGRIFSDYLRYSYRTQVSRGCLFACTYCCNNVFKKLDGNKISPIRWRSLEKQIEELKAAKKFMYRLSEIDFSDDTFLTRSYEDIRKFAIRYKEEIGEIFSVLSIPTSVTYEKIKALAEAGLYQIGIGIQSAHRQSREMYNRKETLPEIINAIDIINRVSKEIGRKIIIRYDFIVDNPWTGEKDVEESIRFALSFKKPYRLCIFSLVFYAGTELYEKAKADGIIKDDLNDAYRITQLIPKPTYMNEIFLLMKFGAPKWLVRLLLNSNKKSLPLVKFLRRVSRFLIWYPTMVKYFFTERLKNNKKLVLSIVIGSIKKSFKSKKIAQRMPQFKGKAGEIV
jgi:anaerobic magnesium-protoporphyrin IX monomethyl ester cyclase